MEESKLTFQVQVDRIQPTFSSPPLPQDDRKQKVWLGLKISAFWDRIDLNTPSGGNKDLCDALLPWRWEHADAGVTAGPVGGWDPYKPESWKVWKLEVPKSTINLLNGNRNPAIDPGVFFDSPPVEVITNEITPDVLDVPELPSRLTKDLRLRDLMFSESDGLGDGRLRAAVLSICKANSDFSNLDRRAALGRLAEDQFIPTIAAYIERLSVSPHPLPVLSRAHGLIEISIEKEHLTENTVFLAAPRLARRLNGSTTTLVPRNDSIPTKTNNLLKSDVKSWSIDLYSDKNQGPNNIPQASVIIQSSLRYEDMHSPLKPQVLDLERQLAIVNDHSDFLSAPDALATLPQKLSDIIDPLTRLRSVLGPVLRSWWAKAESDKQKELRENEHKLRDALNFVAAQILWPRLDVVGRFECPLVERLRSAGSLDTLNAHLRTDPDLHLPFSAPFKAALRVSPERYLKLNLPSVLERRLLPYVFPLDFTREGSVEEPMSLDDATILQRLWAFPDDLRLSPLQDIDKPDLRMFELVDTTDDNIGIEYFRQQMSPDVDLNEITQSNTDLNFAAIRADYSLVYGAPFIEGLVSERLNWSKVNPSIDNPPSNNDLPTRLLNSVQALVGNTESITKNKSLYGQLYVAMTTGESPMLPESLSEFWKELLKAMADEAVVLSEQLVHRSFPFDRITPIPLPLTLAVDQFHTFPRRIDLWARLSGYGLLVARAKEGQQGGTFYSLNAATLHLGTNAQVYSPALPPSLGAPLEWRDINEGVDWRDFSFVDPVPYAPSDHIGISDVLAEFANSWICTTMPGDSSLNQDASTARPDKSSIRFGPPRPSASVKLPALSFGYHYKVAGHLIAIGGVLAPLLRSPRNPYILKPATDGVEEQFDIPNSDYKLIHYLRTVPISAPTIITKNAILPPEGLDLALLADELPQRRASRLLPTSPDVLRWNRDAFSGTAEVVWSDDMNHNETDTVHGLRFEGIVTPKQGLSCQIVIEAVAGNEGIVEGDPNRHLVVTFDPLPNTPATKDGTHEQWLRVDATHELHENGKDLLSIQVWVATRAVKDFPETDWSPNDPCCTMRINWEGGIKASPILALSCVDRLRPIAFEAVRVVQFTHKAANETAKRMPDLIGKAGNASAGKTLLINSINQAHCIPPYDTAGVIQSVKILWPSVDRHTWERWLNAELFEGGGEVKETVIKSLNNLQVSPPPNRESKSSDLPDPAVSGLWLELWEVFPSRRRIGSLMSLQLSPLILAKRNIPEVELSVQLGTQNTSGGLVINNDGSISAVCPAIDYETSVYELRAHAALDPQALTFGKVPTRERLGRAVAELLSPIDPPLDIPKEIENWLIGPAATLPIEVACEPNAALIRNLLKGDKLLSVVAESIGRRLAQVRLSPLSLDAIARLCRFQSITLQPQRWSWRGHPLPPGSTGPLAPDHLEKRNRESQENSDYESDDAFMDRADDDLGRLSTTVLRPYHFTLEDSAKAEQKDTPLVLERDLDWRGGWQLWRFRLVLRSRYANLYRPQYIKNAQVIIPDENGWITREIPDADNGRTPTVPSLAMVLPLTETFMDVGRVPPILALFYGPMHAEHHFGDGITVLTETVEHEQAVIPEYGPDPIRSASGHNGSAVPLRVDGPIGYGFDLGLNSPTSFGHSGFLITPVATTSEPWSFIKLSFLRLENPLGLSRASFTGNLPSCMISGFVAGSDDVLKQTLPDYQAIRHEGLVAQFNGNYLWQNHRSLIITVKCEGDADAQPGTCRVRLTFNGGENGIPLQIHCETLKVLQENGLPVEEVLQAGAHNFMTASAEAIRFRLIVSGDAGIGRLMVHAWIDGTTAPSETNPELQTHQRDTWLSLFQLPLVWKTGTKPPILTISDPDGVELTVEYYPVRMSSPTQPVWCQFTTASSIFPVSTLGDPKPVQTSIDMIEAVCHDGNPEDASKVWKSFRIHMKSDSYPMIEVHESKYSNAEVAERLLVVLTEWIWTQDLRGSGGKAEQPILIDLLKTTDGASSLQAANPRPDEVSHPPLWSNLVRSEGAFDWPKPKNPAYMRLMRVLLPKLATDEANQDISSLWDLFGKPFNDSISDNPPDAGGVILGISRPTTWKVINQ